jgi:putative ABC transport system permease protein
MWTISLRDLEYRSRRFLIAVAVTALVFGIAVAIDGIKRTLQNEPGDLIASFDADAWVVRKGNSSPFTTTAVLPESAVEDLTATEGVRRAVPIVVGRATVTSGTRTNVNVIGSTPLRGVGPEITDGRAPRTPTEAMVSDGLDVRVGDRLRTTTGTFRVVGLSDGVRYNAGAPTLYLTLAGAQRAVLDGQPLVMGVAVTGTPADLPPGAAITSNQTAADDLRLTIKSATKTIDFVALLSWLIAAGVIGAIIYLTAIERTRDFAVMRATGVGKSTVVGGLMVQSLLLAVIAALLSVPLALVLRLGMPLPSTLSIDSLVTIVLVGIIVGVLASLAAVRRAITTDPALAFGGI